MSVRGSNLYERVAKVEANVVSISDSLAEIKQAIRDLGSRMDNRMDKLIYWGCSTILGAFVALSIQLWLLWLKR